MGILEIHGTETKFGGASNGTRIIFEKLLKKNANIHLCSSPQNLVLSNSGNQNNRLDIRMSSKNPVKFINNIRKICLYIQEKKIDLIHSHHRNDAIYACCVKILIRKIKIIHTVHGPSVAEVPDSLISRFIYLIFKFLANLLLDEVIYISHFTKIKTSSFFFKVGKHKVILNGTAEPEHKIDNNNYIKGSDGILDSAYVVAIIGGIEGYKNPSFIIDIAKKTINLKDLNYVFIGDGAEKESLKKELSKNSINTVKFIGAKSNIGDYIKSSDMIASLAYEEGFGRTLIEGMALAKPLIAFNSGGPIEIIKNNINGFLVDLDDFSSYANYIKELYNDRNRAERMGRAGRNIYENYFCENTYVEGYYDEFCSLLSH